MLIVPSYMYLLPENLDVPTGLHCIVLSYQSLYFFYVFYDFFAMKIYHEKNPSPGYLQQDKILHPKRCIAFISFLRRTLSADWEKFRSEKKLLGAQIRCSLKPLNTIVLWWSLVFQLRMSLKPLGPSKCYGIDGFQARGTKILLSLRWDTSVSRIHWENYIFISFHIEWDMFVVTVFHSILN